MFISLEGTEGVGKSTLIQKLADYFEQQGQSVVLTREPGGTALAEQIRSLLLTVNDEPIANGTELLLMYAARVQHICQVIHPALEQGKVVISDRFADASFAYQCFGRGINPAYLEVLNQNFVQVLPDLTFWLDAPIEVGMQRAMQRGELDRFEQEKKEFFTRVREGYVQLHQQFPQRIKRLDATQNQQQVFEQALSFITQV